MGRGRGVGVDLGAAVAVGVGVAVGVAVAVGVGVGDGDPQGLTGQLKTSVESVGAPEASYPPVSQMWSVPLVSVGKLRRALTNGWPSDQLFDTGSYTSTSLDGLGAVLPPPITYMLLQKLSARVSPVARGIAAIVPIVSATGL